MSLSFTEQKQLIATANDAAARFAAKYGKGFFSREDVEDIAATVVMKAMGAMDRFDPEKASLKTWVSRIAANCVKDAVDYKMKRLCISAPMCMERMGKDEDEEVFGADEIALNTEMVDEMSVNDTDRELLLEEMQRYIDDKIAEMPARRQRIAQMMYAGYTPEEMAKAEGCTTNAIYGCIWNIRQALRRALDEWDDAA